VHVALILSWICRGFWLRAGSFWVREWPFIIQKHAVSKTGPMSLNGLERLPVVHPDARAANASKRSITRKIKTRLRCTTAPELLMAI
jgi:hypothetical protein